jgi:hypothetical protein
MARDFIEIAKEEIASFLKNNYVSLKFTVKFNGEFFIAGAGGHLPEDPPPCVLRAVSACEIRGNKVVFHLSYEWIKYAISNIQETQCAATSLPAYSQIKRLEKQLELGLCGGEWDERMYRLAKKILYFLHTKSLSIRQNIVKICAQEYNVIQRHGRIPKEIIEGYRNALCQIEDKI